MAQSNQYHLLAFLPVTEAWEMPPALEAAAQKLMASGRLRINADFERNFVRYGTSDHDAAFSARELTDPALLPETRRMLARHVAPAHGAQGIEDMLSLLRGELRKARGISAEKEQRVARVIVQSAHPSVIQLLLQERTEIFISYAHNVSDLMPVHRWQSDGQNSGMQATQMAATAVYASCGGDPFFEGAHKTYTTDGFPALARMVVILGQELGHFSDLQRIGNRIVGRYSTDAHHMALRSHPIVAEGRKQDVRQVAQLQSAYDHAGLKTLLSFEKSLDFYSKRWRYSPPWLFWQAASRFYLLVFRRRCKRRGLPLKLSTYPYMRAGEALAKFLDDMAFNLAPEADVYRRDEPLEEEAITCIEALARVPQQIHKWGYVAVQFAWPRLYHYYYGTVIPGCIAAAGGVLPSTDIPRPQRLRIAMRGLTRRRPDYYPGKGDAMR